MPIRDRTPDTHTDEGFLKTIAAAMGVLTLIGLLFLGYHYYRSLPPTLSKDSELAQLEKLEHEKKYPELINLMYQKRDKAFSEKLLPWLKSREDIGFAPYYYAQALHLINTGKPEEAMLYYFAGGLVARVDLLRCVDKSAETYIAVLESPFPDVPAYLEKHTGMRVTAGTFAIEMEEFVKDRAAADWLCSQGDIQMKYDQFFPEDEWQGRREIAVESFRKVISERVDEDAPGAEKSLPKP